MHVFGKARVIGGREREVVAQREAARGHARAALRSRCAARRDRTRGCVALTSGAGKQRQADLRISRAGQRAELERREEAHLVAHRGELARRGLQRAHDAVDLGLPGIRHQKNSHGPAGWVADVDSARLWRPTVSSSPRPGFEPVDDVVGAECSSRKCSGRDRWLSRGASSRRLPAGATSQQRIGCRLRRQPAYPARHDRTTRAPCVRLSAAGMSASAQSKSAISASLRCVPREPVTSEMPRARVANASTHRAPALRSRHFANGSNGHDRGDSGVAARGQERHRRTVRQAESRPHARYHPSHVVPGHRVSCGVTARHRSVSLAAPYASRPSILRGRAGRKVDTDESRACASYRFGPGGHRNTGVMAK